MPKDRPRCDIPQISRSASTGLTANASAAGTHTKCAKLVRWPVSCWSESVTLSKRHGKGNMRTFIPFIGTGDVRKNKSLAPLASRDELLRNHDVTAGSDATTHQRYRGRLSDPSTTLTFTPERTATTSEILLSVNGCVTRSRSRTTVRVSV